jgi:FG-GAP repeat
MNGGLMGAGGSMMRRAGRMAAAAGTAGGLIAAMAVASPPAAAVSGSPAAMAAAVSGSPAAVSGSPAAFAVASPPADVSSSPSAIAVASPPAAGVPGSPAAGCSPVGGPLATSPDQALGFRVGISPAGTTAIASAVYSDNFAGLVKVYTKTGGRFHSATWTEPTGRKAKDFYGEGVAVTGTTAVVGAPGWPKGVDGGAVYFYGRSGNTWHLESSWFGTKAFEFLGDSVGISGNTAVVGAPGVNGAQGRGILFQRSGNKWNPTVELIPGGKFRGAMGLSVAISGSVVVAGDPFHYNHGIAYVFQRKGSTWHFINALIDPTPTVNDHFANELGVSGNTIVVGTGYKCNATGAVYVYGLTPTGWHRQATLKNPHARAGDNFGWGVAISGNRILVGAPVKDEHPVARCGTAYEFAKVGRSWPERAEVADPGCSRNDYFGDSVALAGQAAIIGAPGTRKLIGAVYLQIVP